MIVNIVKPREGIRAAAGALQTHKITFAQKARFDNFMNKSTNTNWAIFKNCSYFSSRAFNYTTGLNVTAHPFMIPIHTPSWLVRTILSK